ncbi:MAG: phosphoribosyl-AMP cyclohydrolase [Gammaproteobacteria bacterium]
MSTIKSSDWLEQIKWGEDGLIPAIAQDLDSGRVLCLAWMNREALTLTVDEKRAVYWSRSRQKLWRKGEESGHIQVVHEIRVDCDQDVVLLAVNQVENIACHTGRHSCFYLKLENQKWQAVDPIIKDPTLIYKK